MRRGAPRCSAPHASSSTAPKTCSPRRSCGSRRRVPRATSVSRERPKLPDAVPAPAELIDLYFGFAQKLLEDQREFVKALLDAVSPLVPAHAKPVKVTKPKAATAA